MADQRFRAREIRLRIGRFGARLDEPGFRFNAGGALGKNLRMRGSQIAPRPAKRSKFRPGPPSGRFEGGHRPLAG
jgi:hypothetical protein